jgi:hypothetical protein
MHDYCQNKTLCCKKKRPFMSCFTAAGVNHLQYQDQDKAAAGAFIENHLDPRVIPPNSSIPC